MRSSFHNYQYSNKRYNFPDRKAKPKFTNTLILNLFSFIKLVFKKFNEFNLYFN